MFDLLDEQPPGALGPRPQLRLKEDAHGRVFLAGLSEVCLSLTLSAPWGAHPSCKPATTLACRAEQQILRIKRIVLAQVGVGSLDEAMDVLRRSSRARQKAATALNYGSSRSHSVLAIALYDGAAAAGPMPEGAASVPALLYGFQHVHHAAGEVAVRRDLWTTGWSPCAGIRCI